MESCVDLLGVPGRPLGDPPVWWRAAGSSRCRTTQWHTAACQADPSHVVRPCFGSSGPSERRPRERKQRGCGPEGWQLRGSAHPILRVSSRRARAKMQRIE
jgi:hypothetical protein